jgi:hypothetical protein
MKIQFNTDKTIAGDERNETFFSNQISEALQRFDSKVTRVEVHLKDENGNKDSVNSRSCILEARIEGRQPIAVTAQANTVAQTVSDAINKLKSSLKTILGQMQSHR